MERTSAKENKVPASASFIEPFRYVQNVWRGAGGEGGAEEGGSGMVTQFQHAENESRTITHG